MIPATPDLARMRRERGERLRSAMGQKGVDALLLLGNANVSYATGASWPLSDAGRANIERPVAVVVADDDQPHLFTPFREDAAAELDLDDDLSTAPRTSTSTKVSKLSPRSWRDWCPPTQRWRSTT